MAVGALFLLQISLLYVDYRWQETHVGQLNAGMCCGNIQYLQILQPKGNNRQLFL
jgi:hypothetical protein